MSKAEKLLAAMRNNPRDDWRLEHLQAVARRYGIVWRHDGGSHCVFMTADGRTLPVPARRPIKPIYISLFMALLADAEPLDEEEQL
jgi:hypothetical protein